MRISTSSRDKQKVNYKISSVWVFLAYKLLTCTETVLFVLAGGESGGRGNIDEKERNIFSCSEEIWEEA